MLRSALLLACAATVAGAQITYAPTAAAEQCLSALPATSYARVSVFAVPTVADTTQRAIVPQAALVLQSAIEFARTSAGLPSDSLPAGEPDRSWRQLDHDLVLVAHRDGRLAWRVSDNTGGITRGDGGARWLERALATARAANEAFLAWPDGLRGDSAVVRVSFVRPYIDERGVLQPARTEYPVATFTVLVPRERLVEQLRAPRPRYPEDELRSLGMARVVMQFVVDTVGGIDPASIRDLRSEPSESATNASARAYLEFLRSVRLAIESARYAPARAGGCLVPALVQQRFEFRAR